MTDVQFARFNVIATFPDMERARDAMLALERGGIDSVDTSLLGPGPEEAGEDTETSNRDARITEDVAKKAAAGTAAGGAAGGVVGLLAGAVAFGIPGIGPVVGAGIWASVLGGAAAGGAIGGLTAGVGSLPQDEAWELTFESVREGQAAVGVHAEDAAVVETATGILRGLEPVRLVHFDARGRRVTRE